MATLKDTIVHDRLGVMGDIVSGDYKYNIVYDGGSSVGLTFGDSTYPTTIQGDTATVTTTLILTSNNTYGLERIYSTGSNYWDISGNKSISSNYTLYLPKASGSLVVSTNNTAIGGTYIPVYVDSNNEVKVCSFKDNNTNLYDIGSVEIVTDTSGSSFYYITWTDVTNGKAEQLFVNEGLRYNYSPNGFSMLTLSNDNSATYGAIRIYNSGSNCWEISANKSSSGSYVLYLPTNGSCLVSCFNSTATGGTYVPVYVDSDGMVVGCSFTNDTDLSDIGANKTNIANINAKFVATGDSTHPIYIDSNGNFVVCGGNDDDDDDFLRRSGGSLYGTLIMTESASITMESGSNIYFDHGYISPMTGSTDTGEVTYGIGIAADNGGYLIVTTAGVRMTYDSNSFEVVSGGAVAQCDMTIQGTLAVKSNTTIDGTLTVNGTNITSSINSINSSISSINSDISSIERRLTALENG